jgi:nicotinamidase-related amidase/alkylated DNA repair dioxygenase AlkB
MLSLLDLISQNQPHFQTHQALLVIGLQNDFLEPDGRLPVDTHNGFLDRTTALIPRFRERSSNVIWVQTLYEADRLANDPSSGEGDAVVVGGLVDGVESSTDDDDDLPKELVSVAPTQSRSSRRKQRALDLLKKVSARRQAAPPTKSSVSSSQAAVEEDEELFLLRSARRAPACVPNTAGAEFANAVKAGIEKTDTVLQTTNYSAFLGTKLLLILRAKLVTELFICGCITNVSVLATVIDAARHGIRINVVTDCLGYRRRNRHDEALKRMVDFLDANMVTSEEILEEDEPEDSKENSVNAEPPKDPGDALASRVGALKLNEDGPTSSADSRRSSYRSPTVTLNGRPRTISDASYAESRLTTDTRLSDEQFAEKLMQGAKVPNRTEDGSAQPNKLVKSKIRMRHRPKNTKKENEQKSPAETSKKSEPKVTKDAETPTPESKTTQAKTTAEKVEKATQQPAVRTAGSSDNLTKNPSKNEQALKASVSQPVLPSSSAEVGEPKEPTRQPSRMRLALSRNSKSDSSKASPVKTPTTPKTPTKVETPQKSPVKMAAETPSKTPTVCPCADLAPIPASSTTPKPFTKASAKKKKTPDSLATLPVLGPGDNIGEGDSRIIYDFLSPDLHHSPDRTKPLKELIFHQLYNEVQWQKMLHREGEVPRLVCCQGEFGIDGSMPVYRHPTDQVLPLLHFSPKVQLVRKHAEKIVGHPLNHVLIQLYRSGNDYISEHSDKTLDIVRGSSIVNVSFGAQRTMRLRSKKSASPSASEPAKQQHSKKADRKQKTHKEKDPTASDDHQRTTQRIPLPHNSIFILGPDTNRKWLHGINPDKRLPAEKSLDEKAYGEMRISLTFRHVGTFLDADSSRIWGQGATCKTRQEAADVVNGDEGENERLVRAFGRENHDPEFRWDGEEGYGAGSDVLHFSDAPDEVPVLFGNGDEVEGKMVGCFLAENKIRYTMVEDPFGKEEGGEGVGGGTRQRQVHFRDTDTNHTEVSTAIPILLYLDRYYPLDRSEHANLYTAASYPILSTVSQVLKYWNNRHIPTYFNAFLDSLQELEEAYEAGGGPFIAGKRFCVADCAAWCVVDALVGGLEAWSEEAYPGLSAYYAGVWRRRRGFKSIRPELLPVKKTSKEESEKEQKDGEKGEAKEKEKEKEDANAKGAGARAVKKKTGGKSISKEDAHEDEEDDSSESDSD